MKTPEQQAEADKWVESFLESNLCDRWGSGPGGCIEVPGHIGPCRDIDGETTLTLTAKILWRQR